jgi:hypothetical protein
VERKEYASSHNERRVIRQAILYSRAIYIELINRENSSQAIHPILNNKKAYTLSRFSRLILSYLSPVDNSFLAKLTIE